MQYHIRHSKLQTRINSKTPMFLFFLYLSSIGIGCGRCIYQFLSFASTCCHILISSNTPILPFLYIFVVFYWYSIGILLSNHFMFDLPHLRLDMLLACITFLMILCTPMPTTCLYHSIVFISSQVFYFRLEYSAYSVIRPQHFSKVFFFSYVIYY